MRKLEQVRTCISASALLRIASGTFSARVFAAGFAEDAAVAYFLVLSPNQVVCRVLKKPIFIEGTEVNENFGVGLKRMRWKGDPSCVEVRILRVATVRGIIVEKWEQCYSSYLNLYLLSIKVCSAACWKIELRAAKRMLLGSSPGEFGRLLPFFYKFDQMNKQSCDEYTFYTAWASYS